MPATVNFLNVFNGDDMLAQVRETLDKAQKGAFLPDDFKFGRTDNNVTAQFDAVLAATAPKLGGKK